LGRTNSEDNLSAKRFDLYRLVFETPVCFERVTQITVPLKPSICIEKWTAANEDFACEGGGGMPEGGGRESAASGELPLRRRGGGQVAFLGGAQKCPDGCYHM
jgi:hypothetical protein